MNYEKARALIEDGDLVAVKSSHGGLPAVTRWVTRSPYTHTAVALWLDGGLWAAEMNAGGNVLVPLSRYADTDFDVYGCPVDRAKARLWTLELLRGRIDYDLLDLVRVALHHLANFRLPPDTGGMICSAYTANIYGFAGWRAVLPRIPTPADVVAAIGEPPKLAVSG